MERLNVDNGGLFRWERQRGIGNSPGIIRTMQFSDIINVDIGGHYSWVHNVHQSSECSLEPVTQIGYSIGFVWNRLLAKAIIVDETPF